MFLEIVDVIINSFWVITLLVGFVIGYIVGSRSKGKDL